MMNFDETSWERKIVKIFKALQIMEKSKYLEPHFSISFSDLAQFLLLSIKSKNGGGGTSLSGISQLSQIDPFLKGNQTFSNDSKKSELDLLNHLDQRASFISNQSQNGVQKTMEMSQFQPKHVQSRTNVSTTNEVVQEENPEDEENTLEVVRDREQRSKTQDGVQRRRVLAQGFQLSDNKPVPQIINTTQGYNKVQERVTLSTKGQQRVQQKLTNTFIHTEISNDMKNKSISKIAAKFRPYNEGKQQQQLRNSEGLNQSAIDKIKSELISDQFSKRHSTQGPTMFKYRGQKNNLRGSYQESSSQEVTINTKFMGERLRSTKGGYQSINNQSINLSDLQSSQNPYFDHEQTLTSKHSKRFNQNTFKKRLQSQYQNRRDPQSDIIMLPNDQYNEKDDHGMTHMILVTQSPVRSSHNSKLDYQKKRNDLNNSITDATHKTFDQYSGGGDYSLQTSLENKSMKRILRRPETHHQRKSGQLQEFVKNKFVSKLPTHI